MQVVGVPLDSIMMEMEEINIAMCKIIFTLSISCEYELFLVPLSTDMKKHAFVRSLAVYLRLCLCTPVNLLSS